MTKELTPNILVVDDEPANLLAAEAVLQGLDIHLVKASSGEEALRQVLKMDFALILMDILMPGMDGFETAQLIRERPKSQHTPLIFMTATYKDDVAQARGYSLGAADYLIKPAEPEVLRAKVHAFAESWRRSAESERQAAELRLISDELRAETAQRRIAEEALHRKNEELAERTAAAEQQARDLRQTMQRLRQIEWLITKSAGQEMGQPTVQQHLEQPYGDLIPLNTSRVIAGALEPAVLTDIVDDYLALLDTSAAVYEKNGDYALGLFSSGWCRFMDQTSRGQCGTDDNRAALAGGKWHCHESCWKTSKASIDTGQPADFECMGGIRIYAVPVRAGGEVVGSINFGYGDPPRDAAKLAEIADRYGVTVQDLQPRAEAYESRPPYLVELAKGRLHSSARLVGAMIERSRAQADVAKLNAELEQRVLERTSQLQAAIEGLANEVGERKRAEERLEQQLARLHLIDQITRSIGERQNLQSIYRVVLAQLEENLPVDFNAICSFDAQTSSLQVAAVGPKSQPLCAQLSLDEQTTFPVDTNGLGACLRGETVYEPDITQLAAPFAQRLAKAGLRSLAATALGMGDKTIGVLLTARRTAHGYSSSDCEFLKQLSGHVFLASQHAQLFQDLKTAYDELRESQKTVLQQERLRALGQMASGIAHDINNAISPISIYAESLLEGEPNLTARARDYLTTIAQAIDDVAQTVSRMRDFYRQQEKQLALDPVNLNMLVRQVLDLTRARWRDQPQERGITIDVNTELAENLPAIMGVESEIRDALTNLIFNAVDAMPQGGILTIRTRQGARAQAEYEGAADSPTHALVEVSDTGTGMTEDTRQRCLEPFFTTKGERGTGLGLAMVYGAMRRHSGDIDIQSTLGQGTRIRLLFLLPQGVIAEPVHPEMEAESSRPLRVLMVDDEMLLRKSLEDALQGDGHHVTAADGGQAGIDAFAAAQQRGEPFEIVITDLGMPHVDGRAVARAVKEKCPATPVILLTGWGQRMKSEGDIPAHVDRVLSKPPKLKELRRALAALAAEKSTPVVER